MTSVLPPWLFRFSNLVIASAVVALAALVWVMTANPHPDLPQPLPVAAGEAEIVWLGSAADAGGWERFVNAVEKAARDCDELIVEGKANAFPSQAAACPQLAVRFRDKPGRLLFRWYKITSDWTSE